MFFSQTIDWKHLENWAGKLVEFLSSKRLKRVITLLNANTFFYIFRKYKSVAWMWSVAMHVLMFCGLLVSPFLFVLITSVKTAEPPICRLEGRLAWAQRTMC